MNVPAFMTKTFTKRFYELATCNRVIVIFNAISCSSQTGRKPALKWKSRLCLLRFPARSDIPVLEENAFSAAQDKTMATH